MASKSSVATKNVPTKAKAALPKDADTPDKDGAEPAEKDGPLPLLDLSDAAVKKMIKQAKKRGYVTYEQLNAVMPSEEVTSEKIEDVTPGPGLSPSVPCCWALGFCQRPKRAVAGRVYPWTPPESRPNVSELR